MNEKFSNNVLFRGIPRETLQNLDIAIEECRVDRGEIIFNEGDAGDYLYLLQEGKVLISIDGREGKQETLAAVLPEDFFGEMSLLDGKPRSARATAQEPSVLGRIDHQGLEDLLAHSVETARHFGRLITGQLRSANSQYIDRLLRAERLSLLGSMMTAMVHDFRNPLATFGMVSHFLSSQKGDSRLIEMGQIADDAFEQMQAMIQELLDYSLGSTRLELQPIEIPDFLEKLDRQILEKVEGSGVTVHREIDYDGEIVVDSHRLLRLLLNIVKNSREAMAPGGSLTLRIDRDGHTLKIAVEDTGRGIPPEILATVFEPFVTHGKSTGNGLGMAIAKSVVTAHQGEIWMESEVGRGTTCHIALPVIESSS